MRNTSIALIISAAVSGCVDTGELDTSTVESDSSVYQWSNDVQTGGRSGYQPGLASFGGRLHMLATNMDLVNQVPTRKLIWQRFNGSSWSSPVWTGQYADYGPALAVLNNRLVAVYHAAGQNRLVMTTSDGTNGWSTPVNAGTTLNATTLHYAPALAVRNGALYAAYCTSDSAGNHIRIDQYATTWTTVKQFDLGATCKGISIALEPDGRFRMVFNVEYSSGGWGLFETRDFGGTATSWTTPTKFANKNSKKPPSVVYCNGTTHLLHGGYSSPSEIWWADREGGSWIEDQKVPDQVSDGGAAVACYNGTRPIMVHNGGYDDMWWSEFTP